MVECPLVSVFLPYYNDAEYLEKSIESVLNNSYKNVELILLNHATKDNCREIAHSYADKRIIHIDMDKNYGAGGGILFEKMLQASSGKYIKTLCADDCLREDGLEILVDFMESHPDIDFAFGNVNYIDTFSNNLNDNWFHNRNKFDINDTEIDLIQKYTKIISILPYIGNITKREAFKDIVIDNSFIMLFDMSLWLSLLCTGKRIGFVNKIVADYRIHENQISGLNQEKKVENLCFYEKSAYWKCLLHIKDVELAKQVFPDNPYCSRLKNSEDIPFFILISLYESQYKPIPYLYLDEMLNDKEQAKHLLETFGFDVKTLRDLCNNVYYKKSGNIMQCYKQKMYSTTIKKLGFRQLLFLMTRRIFNIFTGKPLINKLKKKKRYSL